MKVLLILNRTFYKLKLKHNNHHNVFFKSES